jgi:hypothetical protein
MYHILLVSFFLFVLALPQICLILINSGVLIPDMLNLLISHNKGTGHPPDIPLQAQRGGSYSSNTFATMALEGYGWLGPCLGHFTPGEDPVPIIQEAGWAVGPVWTGMETLISKLCVIM